MTPAEIAELLEGAIALLRSMIDEAEQGGGMLPALESMKARLVAEQAILDDLNQSMARKD